MYLKFLYNELEPSYKNYINLLKKMDILSNNFFKLDDIFNGEYNYDRLIEYENKKKKMVLDMFKIIIDYFPILNKIPCAIYLNGSYARNSITAYSDLDLTFYFEKNDVFKYQTLIYLIRYAISRMFRVNIVHVHSFTKNFTTKYRKENNLVKKDEHLETDIVWTTDLSKLKICYPDNQMILEREICEITSIKCITDLFNLIERRLNEDNPKEWMYTHECIHITNNSFNIENKIKKLDISYDKDKIELFLINLKNEILDLSNNIKLYFDKLKNSNYIMLSDFNMIGKRRVSLLINTFATYFRWFNIYNNNLDLSCGLDIYKVLNYDSNLLDNFYLNEVKNNYYYYKYLLSRIEIWANKCNYSFEHRSNDIVSMENYINEYYLLWKNDYNPLEEQINVFNMINDNIIILMNY